MHSTAARINGVLGLFSTILMVLATLVAASSFFLRPDSTAVGLNARVSIQDILVKSGRIAGAFRGKSQEYAFVTFDVDADLQPLFHWNTKQLLAFVVAEYTTPAYENNSVTIWDRVIPDKRAARLHLQGLRSQHAAHPFNEISNQFDQLNVTLRLHWNVVPYVGLLEYGEGPASEPFTIQKMAH